MWGCLKKVNALFCSWIMLVMLAGDCIRLPEGRMESKSCRLNTLKVGGFIFIGFGKGGVNM